jgi:hypothetical protein
MRDALGFLEQQVLNPAPPDVSFAPAKARIEAQRRAMGVPDDQPRPPLPSTAPPT